MESTRYDATLKHADPTLQVAIGTNEVIITRGSDRIVVPRAVYQAAENAKKNPAVQEGLRRTFETLEADKNVTEFGLTGRISDPRPLFRIPRAEFPTIASPVAVLEEPPSERMRSERARLIILKAWLNHARRK